MYMYTVDYWNKLKSVRCYTLSFTSFKNTENYKEH